MGGKPLKPGSIIKITTIHAATILQSLRDFFMPVAPGHAGNGGQRLDQSRI